MFVRLMGQPYPRKFVPTNQLQSDKSSLIREQSNLYVPTKQYKFGSTPFPIRIKMFAQQAVSLYLRVYPNIYL